MNCEEIFLLSAKRPYFKRIESFSEAIKPIETRYLANFWFDFLQPSDKLNIIEVDANKYPLLHTSNNQLANYAIYKHKGSNTFVTIAPNYSSPEAPDYQQTKSQFPMSVYFLYSYCKDVLDYILSDYKHDNIKLVLCLHQLDLNNVELNNGELKITNNKIQQIVYKKICLIPESKKLTFEGNGFSHIGTNDFYRFIIKNPKNWVHKNFSIRQLLDLLKKKEEENQKLIKLKDIENELIPKQIISKTINDIIIETNSFETLFNSKKLQTKFNDLLMDLDQAVIDFKQEKDNVIEKIKSAKGKLEPK